MNKVENLDERTLIKYAIISLDVFCLDDLFYILEKKGFKNRKLIIDVLNEMYDDELVTYDKVGNENEANSGYAYVPMGIKEYRKAKMMQLVDALKHAKMKKVLDMEYKPFKFTEEVREYSINHPEKLTDYRMQIGAFYTDEEINAKLEGVSSSEPVKKIGSRK